MNSARGAPTWRLPTKNPPHLILDKPGESRYDFTIVPVRDVPDGVQAMLTAYLDPPVSFEIFYLRTEAYERALHAAGLVDVTWIPIAVSPEGIEAFGADFWQDEIANPHLIALRAHR